MVTRASNISTIVISGFLGSIPFGRKSTQAILIAWFLFVVGMPQCAHGSSESMVALLARLAKKSNPIRKIYRSKERAQYFRNRLQRAQTDDQRLSFSSQLAMELLNAGDTEASLKQFREWDALAQKVNPSLYESNYHLSKQLQALCHLRIGEQVNCLHNHTSASCILPIRKEGVHEFPQGSEAAIDELEKILARYPEDLSSRWLLNIAYMTLGRYPDEVPAQWLIPESTFDSPFDIGEFRDVAGLAGVDTNGLCGGTIVEDFNQDGWLDILVSSWGMSDPLHLLINEGNGAFKDQSEAAGLAGLTGGLNMIQADYDNDGDTDVLILRGGWMGSEGRHPNSLLQNDGRGNFNDVTHEAGLLSLHPTQTAVWWDYNNDGWLDLFIGNESKGRERHSCELYRNNQDGTFTECARGSGLALRGYAKGTAVADIDQDGFLDLYVSLLHEPNKLFRNLGAPRQSGGAWKFQEMASRAGVSGPIGSFPCWFFDYDNDGWQDLFVAGYRINDVGDVAADYLGQAHGATKVRLYRNLGNNAFSDETKTLGLDLVMHAMGCNYGDLDNDGFLDFYIGTGDPDLATLIPNRMFRNNQGKEFQEVTTSGGFGHLQKGHGVAFADFDLDGDQDVYANMGGAVSGDFYRNVLFENPGHSHHWLKLSLNGVKSNRQGVGARVQVVINEPDGSQRSIHRVLRSGGSFGASPLRMEMGLGKAVSIEYMTINWHGSNTLQRLEGPPLDHYLRITEGSQQWETGTLNRFQFHKHPGKTPHHLHPGAATF